jgi:hypothetical protein
MWLAIVAVVLLAGCDLVFELNAPANQPTAFLDEYGARKSIDIELVTEEALADFSFMVHFVEDPDLVDRGADQFEFTDADGETTLDFEIESYDPETGDLIVWVRIPTGFDNNRLYVYYDGPSKIRDSRPTWSGQFAGVWHLAEGDSGLGDSTGRNMLAPGSEAPTDVAGRVGRGRRFTADQDLTVDPVGMGTLDFGIKSFSFSVWVLADTSAIPNGTPLARGSTDEGGYGIFLGSGEWIASVSAGLTANGNDAVVEARFADQPPPTGDWIHLVAVVDRDDSNLQRLKTYLDGALVRSESLQAVGPLDADPPDLDISRAGAGGLEAYEGNLDEIRVYTRAISETQITVEHKNLTDLTFVTFGPEETAP